MPIIVDKRKGQRSVHIVNNKPNVMDDLIQALRGLNFKFEINLKIVDVAKDDPKKQAGGDQKPQPDQPKVEVSNKDEHIQHLIGKVQQNLHSEVVERLTQPKLPTQNSMPTSPSPTLDSVTSAASMARQQERISQPSIVKVEPKVELSPVRPQPPVAEVPTAAQPTEPRQPPIKYSRADLLQAVQKQTSDAVKQQEVKAPRVIRGTLKLGSVLRCVAIASEADKFAYIPYDTTKLVGLTKIIQEDMDIESLPIPGKVSVGDIVFAKSSEDGCWYRAMIKQCTNEKIVVDFFDWGLSEEVRLENYSKSVGLVSLRYLTQPEVGLSQYPACAMKLKFSPTTSPDQIDEFLKCEREGQLKILAYDNDDETYEVQLDGIV